MSEKDKAAVYVGIDVSKAQLDVAVRPSAKHWQVENNEKGIAKLVDQLSAFPPTLIVLEATGGLETDVAVALAAAQMPVAVINPRQSRDLRNPPENWPKRTRLMAVCWPILRKRSAPSPAGCRMSRLESFRRSWFVAANWSKCWWQRKTDRSKPAQ